MINDLPSEVVNTFYDCCKKLLKGKKTLTTFQKQRLARYTTQLRVLADNKLSQKQKRRYHNQTGNGLFSLIKKLFD